MQVRPSNPGVVPCVERVASPQSPRGFFAQGPSPKHVAYWIGAPGPLGSFAGAGTVSAALM